jgi:hypothetical protein
MGIGCRREKGSREVVLQTKNTFILSVMPNSWKKHEVSTYMCQEASPLKSKQKKQSLYKLLREVVN